MKQISLIIPVYNGEKYLPTMAESVLSQDWENLQVIFSDDGSTDGSLPFLRELARKDPRVLVLESPNGGVSSARNRALKRAEGDYIGFADSDDILESGYLKTLASLLEEHQADVAVCGFHRIYEASGAEDYMPKKSSPITETDREGFRALLLRPDGYTTVMWNKLFRREVLLQEDGSFIFFDETLHIVEDGEYTFRLPVEKAVFTSEPLYRYSVRSSGAMYGTLTERKLTELPARKKIAEYCLEGSSQVLNLARMKYQKGVRDLMFHAVIGGQGKGVRHLLPELKTYRKELFSSPAVSKKEKLKYRVYVPIIYLNLRRIGAFLMKTLSGHG